MHSTDANIAEVQIQRDDVIARKFRVDKPYILFSRHHGMPRMQGTRLDPWKRFNEMVLPPQVQDALFYGQPISLSAARPQIDSHFLPIFNYHQVLHKWNIKTNWETMKEFRDYGEMVW